VCQFHGQQAAAEAEGRFEREIQLKEQPDEIPEYVISLSEAATVSGLIYELKLAGSRSEAKRLIAQGAIEVDGKPISSDVRADQLISRDGSVIRVGKRRWARIFLKEGMSNVGMA
jgi:tyrosyl-tRNA synthetase